MLASVRPDPYPHLRLNEPDHDHRNTSQSDRECGPPVYRRKDNGKEQIEKCFGGDRPIRTIQRTCRARNPGVKRQRRCNGPQFAIMLIRNAGVLQENERRKHHEDRCDVNRIDACEPRQIKPAAPVLRKAAAIVIAVRQNETRQQKEECHAGLAQLDDQRPDIAKMVRRPIMIDDDIDRREKTQRRQRLKLLTIG